MQLKELKNGRLAMLAIAGLTVQEYVTGASKRFCSHRIICLTLGTLQAEPSPSKLSSKQLARLSFAAHTLLSHRF
jgi:hypothetical protein